MFGDEIVEVFWVPKIFLTPERENAIRDCFMDQLYSLLIQIILMILTI